MTTNRAFEISPEDRAAEQALATRYVLGELSEEEFANFEARYASDAGFRERYNEWAEGLSNEPVTEPFVKDGAPQSWKDWFLSSEDGILARLGVVPAVIGALLAALLVVFVTNLGILNDDARAVPAQTVLTTQDGAVVSELSFDPEAGTVTHTLLSTGPGEGAVFELWLVGADGVPVSVGLLSNDEPVTALSLLPEQLIEVSGGAFVMTQEPEGGAGAAGPTGEVIAAGAFDAP